MEKFYLLMFIVLFIGTNLQIKENPIYLYEAETLFVPSTNDDYYYVIIDNISFKIKKESGDISGCYDNSEFFDSKHKYFLLTKNPNNNDINNYICEAENRDNFLENSKSNIMVLYFITFDPLDLNGHDLFYIESRESENINHMIIAGGI